VSEAKLKARSEASRQNISNLKILLKWLSEANEKARSEASRQNISNFNF